MLDCSADSEKIFFLSPHEMKEEIETKHFEHTFAVLRDEPRCRATPHQTGRGVCVSPQPLSHGFYRVMSVKFLFFSTFTLLLISLARDTFTKQKFFFPLGIVSLSLSPTMRGHFLRVG